jgi:hypothetical protein
MSQEYLIKCNLLNYQGRIVLMRAQAQLQMIARLQRNEKTRCVSNVVFC